MTSDPCFFTVSDARFFPGTAVMLNSLRITGNRGEVLVIDRGLTEKQRGRLARVATVVNVSPELASAHPVLARPSADLFRSGLVALIDSDMIVTRELSDVLAAARAGMIAVFPDHINSRNKQFAEWESAFELTAPLRPQPYVNAGLVALSLDHWPGFLARWRRACGRIPPGEIGRAQGGPFWALEQEALNALLMSEVEKKAQWVGPETQSIHHDSLREVSILDEDTVACSYRGVSPAVLHFSLGPKPWEWRAWRRIRKDDAYVCLFPRLAFGEGLAVSLEPDEVAIWLRPGPTARAFVLAADFANRARGRLRRVHRGRVGRAGKRLAAVAQRRRRREDSSRPPTVDG